EMGGGDGPVADPDADQRRFAAKSGRIESQVVLRSESRQVEIEVGRADVEGRGFRVLQACCDPVEEFTQRCARRLEVEAGQIGIVEEPSANLGSAGIADDRAAAVEGLEIVDRGLET